MGIDGSRTRLAIGTPEEMIALGRRLGEILFDGAAVGLSGPLGAGKTTLARGIAEGLGIEEGYVVSSPTYTIMQSYPCSERDLHHMDLYRIKSPDDLDSILLALPDRMRRPTGRVRILRQGRERGRRECQADRSSRTGPSTAVARSQE